MVNESRLRGDYHEYVTAEELARLTGAEKENLSNGLAHGKMLPIEVQHAIEDAGKQCAKIIINNINDKFPSIKIKRIRAVGNEAGAGKVNDVTDIIIELDSDTEEIYRNYSLKFTESEDILFTKNPGIGSILEEYFKSPELQKELDKTNKEERKNFLSPIIAGAGKVAPESSDACRFLVAKLPEKYSRFEDNKIANELRPIYLRAIRDKLVELLGKVPKEKIIQGCKLNLGLDSNVDLHIASIWKDGQVTSEVIELPDPKGPFKISPLGNDNIAIAFEEVTITIRAKFEGGRVYSALKFAAGIKKD